jgi:hypothetical protein
MGETMFLSTGNHVSPVAPFFAAPPTQRFEASRPAKPASGGNSLLT